MPQSLSAVYLHLVYSTKERLPPLADGELGRELHSYVGAASRELDCAPLQVGGVADHYLRDRGIRGTTPAGLDQSVVLSQGSRCAATLGSGTEPLRGSRNAHATPVS